MPWALSEGHQYGRLSGSRSSRSWAPSAAGLSASEITELIQQWQAEYQAWSRRSLADQPYVYVWADGVYFNIRLEEDRPCILVLMGATQDGRKELLAIVDGYRESEQSVDRSSCWT